MSFMQAYKRLDKLCRDINGIGVTGYIEDMERVPTGEYKVSDWKDDYYALKHYRYIRNQIAHDEYASEENMCAPEDKQWVENFYQRIMHQTDPLALYRKATLPRSAPKPIRQSENCAYKVQTPSNTYPDSYVPRKKAGSCGTAALICLVILALVITLSLYFAR